MSVAAKLPQPEAKPSIRTPQVLTGIVLVLAAIASAGGIFLHDLYKGSAWVLSATRGQDWFTLLVAVPVTAVALVLGRRGSTRAKLALIGLVGYFFYTYTGAALAYALNNFFLIYVALFTLTILTLGAWVSTLDLANLGRSFDAGVPRRSTSIFLIIIGMMLVIGEVGQLIPFFTDGTLPLPMQLAEADNFFVYALDLGLVAPFAVLAGVWLWQRKAWGYLLAGFMLSKSAVMGLMLLFTNGYGWIIGSTIDSIDLLVAYGVIGFGGLGMAVWYLRHCKG